MRALTESPHYEKFMLGRDLALEKFLQKYLNLLGSTVGVLRVRANLIASELVSDGISHYDAKKKTATFEKRLLPWFEMASHEAFALIVRLRRTTYALSYMGQAEAIGRVLNVAIPYELKRDQIDEISAQDTPIGGNLKLKVELTFSRLLRDVVDAFQLSMVMAGGEEATSKAELLDRVRRSFPRQISDTKPKKAMARLREAGPFTPFPRLGDGSGPSGTGISIGVIDPPEWDQILEDYFSEEFPPDSPNRTVYSRVFYSEAPSDEGRYEWELERDVTDDFVHRIRDGENDAANDQGITDFQWISIIDKKTDECCLWRDGLTSEEIEVQLKDEHSDDPCDTSVAPAHPFCRCRMVPMTVDIPKFEAQKGWMNFDDWLNEKAGVAA